MTDEKASPPDNAKPDGSKTPPDDVKPDDKSASEEAKRELDRQLESGEENPG